MTRFGHKLNYVINTFVKQTLGALYDILILAYRTAFKDFLQ